MTNGSKSGPRTFNKQSNDKYRDNEFWKKPKESDKQNETV